MERYCGPKLLPLPVIYNLASQVSIYQLLVQTLAVLIKETGLETTFVMTEQLHSHALKIISWRVCQL